MGGGCDEFPGKQGWDFGAKPDHTGTGSAALGSLLLTSLNLSLLISKMGIRTVPLSWASKRKPVTWKGSYTGRSSVAMNPPTQFSSGSLKGVAKPLGTEKQDPDR